MKSILIAVSGGGLGNRLNAMFSAIALHIHTQLPLLLQWNPTSDFECLASDLFDLSSCVQTIGPYPFYPFVQKEESYGEYVLVAAYYSSHPQPYVDVITSESTENQLAKIHKYKDKHYFAVHGPMLFTFGLSTVDISNKFFEIFRPKESIFCQVQAFLSLNNPQIGIHLRLTDKVVINGYSYDHILRELQSLPLDTSKKIFICSDENEYETLVVNSIYNSCHIPKNVSVRVLSNNNSIYREKNTCVPAFIDFLIFTYCQKKFGINSDTGRSTFFACAAFLEESFRKLVHL